MNDKEKAESLSNLARAKLLTAQAKGLLSEDDVEKLVVLGEMIRLCDKLDSHHDSSGAMTATADFIYGAAMEAAELIFATAKERMIARSN